MVATPVFLCSVLSGYFCWIRMARSLREALLDELLRRGLSRELINLLFPERGVASRDCTGQLERLLRFVAGLIRDMLVPGEEVASPHLLSRAIEAMIGERPQPQWRGDFALGEGG